MAKEEEGGTEKAEEGEAWEGVKEEWGGEVLLVEEEDGEEEWRRPCWRRKRNAGLPSTGPAEGGLA